MGGYIDGVGVFKIMTTTFNNFIRYFLVGIFPLATTNHKYQVKCQDQV